MSETKVSAKCIICDANITISANDSIVACNDCKSLEEASRGDMASKYYLQAEQKKMYENMLMAQLVHDLTIQQEYADHVVNNDNINVDADVGQQYNWQDPFIQQPPVEHEEEKTIDQSSSSNIQG